MNPSTRNRLQHHVDHCHLSLTRFPSLSVSLIRSGKLVASNHLGERLFKKNMSQEFFRSISNLFINNPKSS